MITAEQLKLIYPAASSANIDKFVGPLNETMDEYGINTILRRSAFLSQVGEESGQLRYTREIWGPTPAQLRYEGRLDLGNTEPGDGRRFLGRGLIQITGRANYRNCGDALGKNLVSNPQLLEVPDLAAKSAGWYWDSRNCNAPADVADLEKVTRLINGGLTNYMNRLEIYGRALGVLSL